MTAVAPFAAGDRVAVTGATGFIGSAIVRALIARGVDVVALVEPHGSRANLADIDVEVVPADVRVRRQLVSALEGTRAVFHTAALFRFWAKDPTSFYAINVEGTRNVIDAAMDKGCERVVYTSTVATIGLHKNGRLPADETVPAEVDHLYGHYKQTKYVAEHEALRAAAQGAPIVLVHPTFPVGPRDVRPTPTGKVLLDFLNGAMPGYVDTAMNVTHVDDLAQGHLLAFEHGGQGRSYIMGGENLSMRALLECAEQVCGLQAPKMRVPGIFGLAAGLLSQLVEGRLLGREPRVPLEAARMSRTRMIFDDSRARNELGYTSRPAALAITDALRWFAQNGYVKPERLECIHWSSAQVSDYARRPTS
ncbi:MAG: hopanoid-associated sugar epimerase [Acidimicrobiales bacterium]